MDEETDRRDPEGLLDLAVRRLSLHNLLGSRHYALLAKESDPGLSGPDQILAIVDVLLAAGRRLPGDHIDHYSILQVDKYELNHLSLQKKYLDFLFLLNPSRNRFPFAQDAFDLVRCAGYVLADRERRKQYDKEIKIGEKGEKKKRVESCNGLREEKRGNEDENGAFWTMCPYCYHMYQYEEKYEDCCLLCQNCERGFHAVVVSLPQNKVVVDGAEYHYAFGFFPIGFDWESSLREKKKDNVVEISDDSEDNGDGVGVSVDCSRVKQEVGGESGGEGVRMRVKRAARKEKRARRNLDDSDIEDDGGVMTSKKDGSDECGNSSDGAKTKKDSSVKREGVADGSDECGNARDGAKTNRDSSIKKEDVADGSDERGNTSDGSDECVNASDGAKMKTDSSVKKEEVAEGRTAEILVKKSEVTRKRVKSVPRNSMKIMGKLVRRKRVEPETVDELNAELGEEIIGSDHRSTPQVDIADGMDPESYGGELSFNWKDDDVYIDLEEVRKL